MSCLGKQRNLKHMVLREDWDRVRMMLKTKRGFREARKTSKTGMTALHFACGYQPPVDVVEKLLTIHPISAMIFDIFGRLPLHEACMNVASKEVIDAILKRNPMGAYKVDQRGMTPLHHAVKAACVHGSVATDVIVYLTSVAPSAAEVKDENGNKPVDIAIRQRGLSKRDIINFLSSIDTTPKEILRRDDTGSGIISQSTIHLLMPCHTASIGSMDQANSFAYSVRTLM